MHTPRPDTDSSRTRFDDVTFGVCLSSIAFALVAFAGTAAADGPPSPSPIAATAVQQPAVGAFTGSYHNGMPVYRLPGVSVSASRAVETAKARRDDERTNPAATASAGAHPDPAIRGVRPPV